MTFRRGQHQGPPKQPEQVPPAVPDYFGLNGMRLYQPDSILAVRLPHGVGELAAYCKTLTWVGTEYFGKLGRGFGSLGILIVVGIKPRGRVRLWCEQVDGVVPVDVWDVFVNLLEGAGQHVRPQVLEPVACALECRLGLGPKLPFPMVPREWQRASESSTAGLAVPDQLFEVVFPD
jgi:hypothetical protein